MPPFKDEHILIIVPGSQTTLAQLGLPESFTPARLRMPSRMFPAEKKGEWEPYKIREKRARRQGNPSVATKKISDAALANTDIEMSGAEGASDAPQNTLIPRGEEDDEPIYEEDVHSDEGAVWPLKAGRVINWSAFFALLNHVHNTLSPPFHTPILLVAQPAWTAQDHEILTQFVFEKFKTPAFCIMDSALSICYAYGITTATVIDVGFEKVDITAVSEYIVHDVGRGVAIANCAGESMTERLLELLGPKGWTYGMCEQLKKSNICEILPPGTPLPGISDAKIQTSNPGAPTGASSSGSAGRATSITQGEGPRAPGPDIDVEGETGRGRDTNGNDTEENDGVLDVASIVASGRTQEFLAKKEREKAEKASAKKGGGEPVAPVKPARLPNSKRDRNYFFYEEFRSHQEIEEEAPVGNGGKPSESGTHDGEAKKGINPEIPSEGGPVQPVVKATITELVAAPPPEGVLADTEAVRREQAKAARREERRRNRQSQLDNPNVSRREIEVGQERFLAASGGILEAIADGVHRTILAVEEVGKRGELWDSLIIAGNGSKVRGFKDALTSTLTTKYLISPSSATIFTSELPSNLSTPLATGANTPQPQLAPSTSSHVNPLLLAATTASNPALNPAASVSGYHSSSHQQHSSHGQTPTSIKIAKFPEYFPEWKDAGFEEAIFLGAQVAAKVIFVVDQGLSKAFMTRTDYNESGPQGIHEFSM